MIKGSPRSEATIRRLDWILLPLLGFSTLALVSVSVEFVARRNFSESTTSLENCLLLNDPAEGVRGVPNCVVWEKALESLPIEMRLDEAGYRSGISFASKSPGTFRIVLIGSSVAMGERVSFDETLAALLPKKLSRLSGRRVELYNEGMAYGFAGDVTLRFSDALSAQPDLILWLLTPLDIQKEDFIVGKESFTKPPVVLTPFASAKRWLARKIRDQTGNLVTGRALRHWFYEWQSQSQYVHLALTASDDDAVGFLKQKMSPQWLEHFRKFDLYAAEIELKAKAAGVPFVATFAPDRLLAALISSGAWPSEVDPYQLDKSVQAAIVSHGGVFIDILPDFHQESWAEHLFYPIDGHPTPQGQAYLADVLAKQLSDGAIISLGAVTSFTRRGDADDSRRTLFH